MANEAVWATLTQASIQTSGASATSAATVSAGTLATSMHSNYSLVDLSFTGTMAASIAAASNFFTVYARRLNVDGTADDPTPGASYKAKYMGPLVFAGSAASGGQTATLEDVRTSPWDTEFFISNDTNATLNAGWTLKAIPKTLKPL